MRMWNLPPAKMCRKHLLGEHVELHMMVGSWRRGIRMDGFINTGLMDPSCLLARHNALVAEMARRGYRHQSPIDPDDAVGVAQAYKGYAVSIDLQRNRLDLIGRCPDCAALDAAPPA